MALATMPLLGCAQPTNDAVALPADAVYLNTLLGGPNTNWIGRIVKDVLKDKPIKQIFVIDTDYSQAPVPYLVGLVRDVWQSKEKLQPCPPHADLNGTPLVFLVHSTDGTFIKVEFRGDYTLLITTNGVASFRTRQEQR